jgi:hypothetical protein
MLRWQCHKQVEAGKILAIEPVQRLEKNCDNTGLVKITVKIDKGTEDVYVGYEYVDRFLPDVGGYIVRYDDGYLSYSPAQPFESGYTKTRDLEAAGLTKDVAGERRGNTNQRLRDR